MSQSYLSRAYRNKLKDMGRSPNSDPFRVYCFTATQIADNEKIVERMIDIVRIKMQLKDFKEKENGNKSRQDS